MIFIDWISPPDHLNFNRSLFSALHSTNSLCYVFHKKLLIQEANCRYIKSQNSRFIRFLDVLKIFLMSKKEKIIFITYDPLFLPIFSFFNVNLTVYEHNTVPEMINFNKHAIWQKLMFGKVKRMAQFKGQYDNLKKLKQNVFYVGSPISIAGIAERSRASDFKYYIAPSYRTNLDNIKKMIPFLHSKEKIIVKTAVWKNSKVRSKFFIHEEYINIKENFNNICGIIISIESRVRGSGWFNEAITFGFPIIIPNKESVKLFKENFPRYPFIDLTIATTKKSFKEQLLRNSKFCSKKFIERNNLSFRENFLYISKK